MPTFYLMRHAHALNVEQSPIRALSEQGREGAFKVAEFFRANGIRPNTIYHSDIERSKETANIIAEHLGLKSVLVLLPQLDPDLDVKELAVKIPDIGDQALLIGHLPNIEFLSNFLLTYQYDNPTITFVPGAVAAFRLGQNHCLLEWLVNPEILQF